MWKPGKLLRNAPVVATVCIVMSVAAAVPSNLFRNGYSFVLLDESGALLGASISIDGSWAFPALGAVPEKFEQAVLAFEDRRFYSHIGIDPLALARAVSDNLKHGRVVSGGSTISMQVARLGLSRAVVNSTEQSAATYRSIWQKGLEALVALKLEATGSKQKILRDFAAHAPFGGNVVGLEAAAWRYFGRYPNDLSWAEAATLAVLPNAPALIHPGRNRSLLLEKRDRLLRKLNDNGTIDDATLSLSLAEELPPAPFPMPRIAPHLLETIKSGRLTGAFDFMARSTLKIEWQQRATNIVNEGLKPLTANGIHNAALIIIENESGKVRAYVGNASGQESIPGGFVDIVQSPRSTGSLLKPFLFAGMLDQGQLFPDQLVMDIPTIYPGFIPENNINVYRGAVPAYMALAQSLNVPAVRLLSEYSVDRFYADLSKIGMTTLFRKAKDYGLPLIIGGAEGTLWELSSMYAGLARTALGYDHPFHPARVLSELRPTNDSGEGTNCYTQGAAYLTLQALVRVQRPGVWKNWEEYKSSKQIAWKTGTSQGFRDAWAIGTTKAYTVGVWVGNASGEARPELGGMASAAPMMFSAFEMLPDSDWFEEPIHALKAVEVCSKSGLPPGLHCEKTRTVKIPNIAHMPAPCPYCITAHLDATGTYRTNTAMEGSGQVIETSWFVLPPAAAWYYRMWNTDYRPLPAFKHGTYGDDKSISLNYPARHGEIFIPRELSGIRGSFIAEATHRDPKARIYWHLDTVYLGVTRELHTMAVQTSPGSHILTLVDDNGESIECPFLVLGENDRAHVGQ